MLANVPFGVDINIVIGFILSQESVSKGMFKVWVDGNLAYSKENLPFGRGQFLADGTLGPDSAYVTGPIQLG